MAYGLVSQLSSSCISAASIALARPLCLCLRHHKRGSGEEREEERKVAKTRSSWWVLGYSKKKAMRSTGAAEGRRPREVMVDEEARGRIGGDAGARV